MSAERDRIELLGVRVRNDSMEEALADIHEMLGCADRTRCVFFVNAHTLNVAVSEPDYRGVLNAAERVYGDGTGVRWAAAIVHGVRLRDNVNGTDLVPRLLDRPPFAGARYFLLGATADAIARAAEHARRAFPAWIPAGHHHGYLDDEAAEGEAVACIEAARPHLLLVGMGNPLQERWILRHRERLRVPVMMGVGGLLTYWSGDLDRAPAWMRRFGVEWVHLLIRQPRKARRYLIGNPLFLARVLRSRGRGPDRPLRSAGR